MSVGEESLGLAEQILVALRRIIRAVDLHSKALAQHYGLTGPQIVVLQELGRFSSLSTGELAKRVHLSQGTVSDILERLEKRGLIERRRSPEDRRRVLNRLTREALDRLAASPPLLQERFLKELEKLKRWEQTHILATLQRVAEMMQAEDLAASPVLISGPMTASASETAEFLSEDEGDGRCDR